MWVTAVGIVIAGLIIAVAIRSNKKQQKIDSWYESLPENERQKYERTTDQIINDTFLEGSNKNDK